MWAWAKQTAHPGAHKTQEYHKQILAFLGIITAFYVVTFVLCQMCNKAFRRMTRQQKSEYVGRSVAILHALIVSATSTMTTFFMW